MSQSRPRALRPRRSTTNRGRIVMILACLCAGIASLAIGWASEAQASRQTEPSQPIPLLAYYYIWFNTSSWQRAKSDLPALGRYSSDEQNVMREHVRSAKSAGIDGFIVSWKDTPLLTGRLSKLIRVADEENFKLAVIYQGLDFERRPLAAGRVAADLDFFARNFATDPAFKLFSKPLVIWSGTWKFTREEIAEVAHAAGGRLLLLASEKNIDGYERVADLVDGDAYYWSSVNPETYPNYPAKLVQMGAAVHARQGLWVAPAAVGFDARMIGGTTVVERKDGETLRKELNGALASSPDAIGLISWNEFSENSHIEPSRNYGDRYLRILKSIRGGPAPSIRDFDSDAAAAEGRSYGLAVVIGTAVVGGFLLALTILRRRGSGA